MNLFFQMTRWGFKLFFRCIYAHKVYGLEHWQKGRGIIAPNHTSFFDPPLIAASCPEDTFFLARKTLFSSPIFGLVMNRLNSYPVDGTAQDLGSIKLVCKLLSENKKVVIFPEGMRSSDGKVGIIKSGIGMLALRSKSPITPIYIVGCYGIWNRYDRFPKFRGHTVCIFGSMIDWQKFIHLEKKEAQEAIALKVKESLENLKNWYEKGAIGSPP